MVKKALIFQYFSIFFKNFKKKCKKVLTSNYEFGILIWQSKNCAWNITKIRILLKKYWHWILILLYLNRAFWRGEKVKRVKQKINKNFKKVLTLILKFDIMESLLVKRSEWSLKTEQNVNSQLVRTNKFKFR